MFFKKPKIARINKRRLFKLALVLVILLVGSVGLFWFEFTGRDEALGNKYPTLRFVNYLPKFLDIFYLPLMIKGPDVPEYELIIDSDYLKNLDKLIPKGVCCNCLPDEADKYSSAVFKFEDKEYKVNIKVRGDCSNHWSYDKKSWRIKFADEDSFSGLKIFDLIIPADREFVAEYLNNYRAKKLGLAVPEMKIVTLRINGQYYGAYLQEERSISEMLEKNKEAADVNIYSDDVINDRLFLNTALWQKNSQDSVSGLDNYAELDFLLDLINNASDEEFYLKITELVDMDNFYRWNILSMLAGSYHQDFAHNMRIYFDNTVGKFKFIPADVGLSTFAPTDIIYNPLVTRIIKNPEFIHARNQILWDYVKDEDNLNDDLNFFDQAYDQIRWATYRDRKNNYSNFYFDKKIKIRRQQYKNLYYQAKDVLAAGKVAVKIDISNNLETQLNNLIPLVRFEVLVDNFSGASLDDLEIILKPESSISNNFSLHYDSNKNKILDIDDEKLADFQLEDDKLVASNVNKEMLADRIIPDYIDYNSEDFEAGVGPLFKEIRLKVTSHNLFLASNKNLSTDIFDNFKLDLENAITEENIDTEKIYLNKTTFNNFDDIFLTPAKFVKKYPQFRLVDNSLILPIGNYSFSQDVIIPRAVDKLIIDPGVILNLGPEVSIFSYASIQAKGTLISPITIKRSNIDEPWGVLVVLNQEDNLSEFENVKISGGSQEYLNGIFVSGQLSFYNSDVKIKNCEFSKASGDDSLNVKDAWAEISDNVFFDNEFDAIDLDFGSENTQIVNNQFFNNGNDAIDISGSSILIKNNKVLSSGDKCISIGEHSDALVENNLLRSCNIGIAVKDLSQPQIINNTIIDNNDSGVAVYEKKPIFGGAQPKLEKNIIWGNKTQIFVDQKSLITIANSSVEGGWEGEGNIETKPEFDNNYIAQNLDIGFK